MRSSIVCGSILMIPMLASVGLAANPEPAAVQFEKRPDGLAITVGGRPFATYVTQDETTTRPFFKDLYAPGDTRISRNRPPKPGEDPTDHATMHPGLWMAFGDISGADGWRNKDRVRHAGFVEPPKGGIGRGEFAVHNLYEKGGKTIAEEVARFTILARPEGNLLLWDSTFKAVGDAIVFGDQEEMGLGIRMATPLTVKHGSGQILNSDNLKNEKQLWGKPAAWCAYDGPAKDGTRAGIVLMAHPKNFRESRFHARDYGLLVANPFAINAFTKGEKSAVAVKPGQTLRLRFGVLLFQGKADYPAAYGDYLKAARP